MTIGLAPKINSTDPVSENLEPDLGNNFPALSSVGISISKEDMSPLLDASKAESFIPPSSSEYPLGLRDITLPALAPNNVI
jgi:hypothetical protein